MGVVRREGDWRLEKRDQGLYEITYRQELREVVRTPKYTPGPMEFTAETVPVHEVDSYAEAEGLFEERAHGNQRPSIGSSGGLHASTDEIAEFDLDVPTVDVGEPSTENGSRGETENHSPGAFALVLIIAGVALIWTTGFALDSLMFQIGVLLLVGGLAIVGGAVLVSEDLLEAFEYLTSTPDSESTDGAGDSTTEKTPPAPDSLKHDIIFDRANQTCEWCEDPFDQLHVHHIQPRSEGGPNTRRNLIALCPNCHSKADAGVISKTKLRAKVRRLEG